MCAHGSASFNWFHIKPKFNIIGCLIALLFNCCVSTPGIQSHILQCIAWMFCTVIDIRIPIFVTNTHSMVRRYFVTRWTVSFRLGNWNFTIGCLVKYWNGLSCSKDAIAEDAGLLSDFSCSFRGNNIPFSLFCHTGVSRQKIATKIRELCYIPNYYGH